MENIMATIGQYWPIVTGVISLAAAIAVVTPSKSDDRRVQLILDIINKLGLNLGKAKNADDV